MPIRHVIGPMSRYPQCKGEVSVRCSCKYSNSPRHSREKYKKKEFEIICWLKKTIKKKPNYSELRCFIWVCYCLYEPASIASKRHNVLLKYILAIRLSVYFLRNEIFVLRLGVVGPIDN